MQYENTGTGLSDQLSLFNLFVIWLSTRNCQLAPSAYVYSNKKANNS